MKLFLVSLIFVCLPLQAVTWSYLVSSGTEPGPEYKLDSSEKSIMAGQSKCEISPVEIKRGEEYRYIKCLLGEYAAVTVVSCKQGTYNIGTLGLSGRGWNSKIQFVCDGYK